MLLKQTNSLFLQAQDPLFSHLPEIFFHSAETKGNVRFCTVIIEHNSLRVQYHLLYSKLISTGNFHSDYCIIGLV
jgi:hypothetical protein